MKARIKREKRDQKIVIYYTAAEYKVVMGLFRQTTCRSRAEYGRKLTMNKPVAVTYRNRSIDDVVEAANGIRRQMEEVMGHSSLGLVDKEQLSVLFTEIDRHIYQLSDLCIPLLKSAKAFTESSITTSEK